MIVNTHRLFALLLARLQISTVCEVGCLDGRDSAKFHSACPQSTIYAFEPHPTNFERLQERYGYFAARNIHVLPWAVSNRNGEADFYLVGADHSRADPRRGMSSLHQRMGGEWTSEHRVRVRTTRLDSFLTAACTAQGRVAVWIDSEGAAYEVVEGLSDVAAQVQVLHVEVETECCIGAAQALYPRVAQLLGRLGFRELATDFPRRSIQFNALFVRSDLSRGLVTRLRFWLVLARLRYLLIRAAGRVCPAGLRRYERAKATAAS